MAAGDSSHHICLQQLSDTPLTTHNCSNPPAPQLTSPVQWETTLKTLLGKGLEKSYEVGPLEIYDQSDAINVIKGLVVNGDQTVLRLLPRRRHQPTSPLTLHHPPPPLHLPGWPRQGDLRHHEAHRQVRRDHQRDRVIWPRGLLCCAAVEHLVQAPHPRERHGAFPGIQDCVQNHG